MTAAHLLRNARPALIALLTVGLLASCAEDSSRGGDAPRGGEAPSEDAGAVDRSG